MTDKKNNRPYRCPGCDSEAYVYIQRSSHPIRPVAYSIGCDPDGRLSPNECLGQWFRVRTYDTETSAISSWNTAIIEMAASALGITTKQARAIKES